MKKMETIYSIKNEMKNERNEELEEPQKSISPEYRQQQQNEKKIVIDKSFRRATSINQNLKSLSLKSLGIRIQVTFQKNGFFLKEIPPSLEDLKATIAEKVNKKVESKIKAENVDSLIITYIGKNHEEVGIKDDKDYMKMVQDAKDRLKNRQADVAGSMMELGKNLNSSNMSYSSRTRKSVEKIQLIARVPSDFLKVRNAQIKNNGGNRTMTSEGRKRVKLDNLNMSVQPVIRKMREEVKAIGTPASLMRPMSAARSPILNKSDTTVAFNFLSRARNIEKNPRKSEETCDNKIKLNRVSKGNDDSASDYSCDHKNLLSRFKNYLTKSLPKKNNRLQELLAQRKMPCDKCYGIESMALGQKCRYCNGTGQQVLDQKTEIMMSIVDLKVREYFLTPLQIFFGIENGESGVNEDDYIEEEDDSDDGFDDCDEDSDGKSKGPSRFFNNFFRF